MLGGKRGFIFVLLSILFMGQRNYHKKMNWSGFI